MTRPSEKMPRSLRSRWWAPVIASLALLSCLGEEPRGEADSPATPTSRVAAGGSPAFDLSAVVRRVEDAFRPDGSGHLARGEAHELRVVGGSASFRALHHEEDDRLEATLTFETRAVRRGEASLLDGSTSARVGEAGELVIERGSVDERLRNSSGGVEQSWSFARRPDGAGELLVEVGVEGQEFAGRTSTGLHFVDPTSGVGVRYGHATWIDATGQAYTLSSTWDGESIELRVPSKILESSTYPAVLDPVISPEYGVDAPARGPATRWQSSPDVAFDGTHYLVVWKDLRAGDSDIYAARLDATGAVIDHGGIPVATGFRLKSAPRVESDGADFFVVWSERRGSDHEIRGARIADDGQLIDTSSFALAPVSGEGQRAPEIVFDGTNYLVVWLQEGASTNSVVAARVAPTGNVLDPNGITITSAAVSYSGTALAFNGSHHLIGWTEFDGSDYDVFAARLAADGSLADATPLSIAASSYTDFLASIASDGADFLVVWADDPTSTATYDLRATRVGADGAIVDVGGFSVSTAAEGQSNPSVSFDGANYLVTWEDSRSGERDIYAARVGVDGTVHDPAGFVICDEPRYQAAPRTIFDGARHLVVWTDDRAGATDIYAARVETTGSVTDPDGRLVTTAPRNSKAPTVAFDGVNHLVVWEHDRGTHSDIYAVRVDATGSVLDPDGIPVATTSASEWGPTVGFDGANYLIAWTDDGQGDDDIAGRLMTPAGALLGADPFVISGEAGSQYGPTVDFDGTNYLIAWTDYRAGNADVYAARVDTAGALLDPSGVAVTSTPGVQHSPSVAFGGGQYLLTWVEQAGTDLNVVAARVDTGLNVLDPNGFAVSAGPERETSPALAYDQTQFLAVWSDARNGGYDLFGARIDPSGALLDPSGFAISTGASSASNPEVVFSGGEYLVVWEDAQQGAVDLRGARLDRSGALLGGADFVVSDDGAYEQAPSLAPSGPAEYLVVYSAYWPGRADGAQLKMRTIAATSTATAPTADSQTVVVDEDGSVAITLTGSSPNGFPLSFHPTSSVAHGTLTGTAPALVYTPTPDYFGSDLFHFITNDGALDSPVATVTIDVQAVNDAPILVEPTPADGATLEVDAGSLLSFELAAEDRDDDTLGFEVDPLPAGALLDATTGEFSWTPAAAAAGEHPLILSVSDGEASDAREIVIRVIAEDPAPTSPDAGATTTPDAGSATLPDGGTTTVTPDAGAAPDVDAGSGGSAGGDAGGPIEAGDTAVDEGCGCSSLSSRPRYGAHAALLVLLGLWFGRRRLGRLPASGERRRA